MVKINVATGSGAQLEIFQGRGGFMGVEHFDKHFIKKKTGSRWETIFLSNTLKTTFCTKMVKSSAFFSKSGHFFRFSKKDRGGRPPSCAPTHLSVRTTLQWFCIFTLLWGKPGICLKWENIVSLWQKDFLSMSILRINNVCNRLWSPKKRFSEKMPHPLLRFPYPRSCFHYIVEI